MAKRDVLERAIELVGEPVATREVIHALILDMHSEITRLRAERDAYKKGVEQYGEELRELRNGIERVPELTPCRIYDYDGAFECYAHGKTWGAVPDPDPDPCAPDMVPQSGGGWRTEQCKHQPPVQEPADG